MFKYDTMHYMYALCMLALIMRLFNSSETYVLGE